MKDKINQCQYTHQQLIDADRYAYNMSGSSPCEDCNEIPSNLYLQALCQEECEEYCNWVKVYRKYFNKYLDNNVNNKCD